MPQPAITFPPTFTRPMKQACLRFKNEICDRVPSLDDEFDDLDWYDMSIGFLLACGLPLDRAVKAALWLRYDMHYTL